MKRTWLVLALVMSGMACSRSEPAYPSLLNPERAKQVREELKDCNLVFVGELLNRQSGWFPPTGAIAPSYQHLRYKVIQHIRGEVPGSEFDLAYNIFGGQPDEVQQSDGGPYQLDPNYYRKGTRYIVLAGAPSYESSWVECSTWKATPDNLKQVRALADQVAFAPTWGKASP